MEAQGHGSPGLGSQPPGAAQSGKPSRRGRPGEEKGERRASRWGQLMEQEHSGWRQSLGVKAFPKVTEAVRMEATDEQPEREESGEQNPQNEQWGISRIWGISRFLPHNARDGRTSQGSGWTCGSPLRGCWDSGLSTLEGVTTKFPGSHQKQPGESGTQPMAVLGAAPPPSRPATHPGCLLTCRLCPRNGPPQTPSLLT